MSGMGKREEWRLKKCYRAIGEVQGRIGGDGSQGEGVVFAAPIPAIPGPIWDITAEKIFSMVLRISFASNVGLMWEP